MTGQRLPRARETVASAAQYVLLGGFASTAAGISAQGLVGFARSNMALRGPWPYLLFSALDGAAGVCAVLLVRRVARAEPGLAPGWPCGAWSPPAAWTHAPRRPAAPEAFGLMPVIAALLFEFCLREVRLAARRTRQTRTLDALRWLRPAQSAIQGPALHGRRPAGASAGNHRSGSTPPPGGCTTSSARSRLPTHEQAARPGMLTARRIRRAQRRACGALIRAGFTEPLIAFAVLRQVQAMTQTNC